MSFLRSISAYMIPTVLTTSSLFSYDREKRISDLERQMLEVGAYHPGGGFGARFASSSIDSSWEISAEVLLWQAKVGGTDYAYSVSTITDSGATPPIRGTISEISFDWDWGFRCGLGKQNIYGESDLLLVYTRYFTAACDGHRKDLPSGFLGLTGFLDPALIAKSRYQLHYQNIDLELGKAYFVSKQLLIRSHIGLKFSLVTQKQNSHYEFNIRSGDLVSFISRLKDKCDFFGLGPRAGVHTRWYLGREVSLTNKLAGALLYGYYKVEDFYNTNESRTINGQAQQSFGKVHLKGSSHHFSPFAEMLIGLSWNRAYIQDKVVLMISLSYETLYFWRQRETISGEGARRIGSIPTLLNSSGTRFAKQIEDIGFRGISLTIEIDF